MQPIRLQSITKHACIAAGMLCCVWAGAGARADGEHVERLDAIEVTGRYENAIGTSDSASQGYITPKLIQAKPLMRPAEILEYVPGVIVTQHSGDGKANQFYLRGFNLDHGTDFRTTVAGLPVNMPTHAHGQGYSDLNFLIPELVQRIDYRKGPYFATDGDFSSAGAAHFQYQEKLPQNLAAITAGNNNYRRALLAGSAVLSEASGPNALLYAIEFAGNDGPWENPSRYGKQNAVLRYSFGETGSRHLLTAMAYQGDWRSSDQIPRRALEASGPDTLRRFGTVDASDGGQSQRYSLSYDYRHTHKDSEFHLNAYALRYRLRLYSNFTYFLDDPVNGDQFEQLDQRSVFGISPNWFWSGRIGERESTVKAGLQMRRDHIGAVGLYHTVGQQRLGTVREDSVQQTGIGAYIEHSLQWNDWLRSVLGARYDLYRADVQSSLAQNSGRTRDHIASPKLNLIAGPFAQTEYFISLGAGFHSNDARGTTTRVDPSTLAAVTPAPALVRSSGAELGARTELVPNLQSSLALWRLALDSELLFAGDAGTTTATRPSQRRGLEWSNRWRPRPWLIFDADVSFSRAQFSGFDPAGSHIPGAIDRVLALGASLDSLGPWSGGLQLRYFGPRPLIEDASVKSQSTLLWNMRAGYRLGRGLRLHVDVLNIFNRKASDVDYFYASRLRNEPAPVGDIHFHPAEPRAARLTISADF